MENQAEIIVKPKTKKPRKVWTIERAKSGRSRCGCCNQLIPKDALRLGVVTFYPHRNCKWYHFSTCMNQCLLGASVARVGGLKEFSSQFAATLEQLLNHLNATVVSKPLPAIVGDMNMPMFATALTSRYNRFRSFRFGLPEEQMYTKNWNWRCFLATMLVCNTHESAMLAVTDKLFKVYRNPEELAAIEGDKETQKAWKDWMDTQKLRHTGKKMAFILRANRRLLADYDGDIPNDRDALEEMNGVGRHVASVTMAWVHQAPEFGIDTHVSRILKRWGYIEDGMDEEQVETIVKRAIPEKQIGHFSRAFVDHGQQVCGFTPDCQNCYLRGSCPTARKYADLDW
tara:strand:+ start:986 stop:2011 length:1026 start_codon:yes stop_codon:yes gene_type:complete